MSEHRQALILQHHAAACCKLTLPQAPSSNLPETTMQRARTLHPFIQSRFERTQGFLSISRHSNLHGSAVFSCSVCTLKQTGKGTIRYLIRYRPPWTTGLTRVWLLRGYNAGGKKQLISVTREAFRHCSSSSTPQQQELQKAKLWIWLPDTGPPRHLHSHAGTRGMSHRSSTLSWYSAEFA